MLLDERGHPLAAHVRPELPRVIQAWDGYQWTPVCVAPDLAAARSVLYPDARAAFTTTVAPVVKKPGRHRKPAASRPD